MIEPRSLDQMIAASRHEAAQKAIVAELARLMRGVNVEAHPGRLDINDVVEKKVVPAPGVAVGWTRIRADPDVAGTFAARIEWAAYIVAEARADTVTKTAVSRETVAHAIGAFLLAILNDPDVSGFGIGLATPALRDPAPQLAPLFTLKSYGQGLACYSVTWSQDLLDNGEPIFAGATPGMHLADDEPAAEFDGLPPEVVAMMAGDE